MQGRIFDLLSQGDKRTTTNVDTVVTMADDNPMVVPTLNDGIENGDEVLAMHCADALQKISAQKPALLTPHVNKLVKIALTNNQ